MEIQSNHIKEAEAILIDGNTFDEVERVPFIKNLETRDLLAVPGSGKTTALQAKLYCLSKQMPFEDRAGILVLSHTNKAVEEIEKKLKDHCPQLFQHPNFVGTVQSFVNKFITNGGCYSQYGSYIHINDKEAYEKEAMRFYKSLQWKKSEPKGLKNKLFGRLNRGKDSLSFAEKENNIIEFLKNFELDITNRKLLYNNETLYKFDGDSKQYYLQIEQWKESLYSHGMLNFKDSFNIGSNFLQQNSKLKSILQTRFKYIFIDEAQDLEKYQLDIIESIFNTEESNCVIQRIGDINQSIYNSGKSIKIECDWEPRNPMPLNSSMRLTKEIADIVDCFTLKKEFPQISGEPLCFKVEGKRTIETAIPPYLIIFDQDTTGELKLRFEELIRQHSLFDGFEGTNTKKGYKIIGWSGTWKDEDSKGKLRLENIFPDEYRVASGSKIARLNLCEYLICNPQNKILKKYSDNIIDALCVILRIAECMNKTTRNGKEVQRYYTSQTLWRYLVEESRKSDSKLSEQDLLDFKSKIYTWSFSIATNNQIENTYNEIKSFVTDKFSNWCGFSIEVEVIAFLGTKYDNTISEDTNPSTNTSTDIPIEVCSIHSVKGQTHCATMYVETSYYQYEIQKLIVTSKKKTKIKLVEYLNNPLLLQEHNYKEVGCSRAKEAMKMMYVGFSRPTHLLCFAVLKANLTAEYLSFFQDETNGWNVIDLTENTKSK